MQRAVRLQPANAATWRQLGRLELNTLDQPDQALQAFRAALYLDPQAPASQDDFLAAQRAAVAAKGP